MKQGSNDMRKAKNVTWKTFANSRSTSFINSKYFTNSFKKKMINKSQLRKKRKMRKLKRGLFHRKMILTDRFLLEINVLRVSWNEKILQSDKVSLFCLRPLISFLPLAFVQLCLLLYKSQPGLFTPIWEECQVCLCQTARVTFAALRHTLTVASVWQSLRYLVYLCHF